MRKIGKYERLTTEMEKKVAAYNKKKAETGMLKTYMMSLISLVLCCTMFLSTTFAWFTSEVVSEGNEIYIGKLAVDMIHEGVSLAKAPEHKVFDDRVKWEPGVTHYETLTILNRGDLSFDYRIMLCGGNDNLNAIGQYISVYAIDAEKVPQNMAEIRNEWNYIGKLNDVIVGSVSLIKGKHTIDKNFVSDTSTEQEVSKVTIALHMEEDTSDPEIMGKKLEGIGIKLVATQKPYEEDAFGNQYDAKDPAVDSVKYNKQNPATLQVSVAPSTNPNRKMTTITVPANVDAFDGKTVAVSVNTTNTLFNISAAGSVIASLDVDLTVDGVPFTGNLSSGVFTVATYIPTGLNDATVSYAATGVGYDIVNYDPVTGLLIFTTNHFSQYNFAGKGLAYDPVDDRVLNDVVEIVEALQITDSKVVVPDANKATVTEKIQAAVNNNQITEEQQTLVKHTFAVAAIGSTNYSTLQEAIDAAGESTIVLLKNVYLDADNTITIPEGKSITLDLNNNTISAVSDDADKNDDNKYTSADNEVLFDVRGTLTVQNGIITIQHMGTNLAWNGCTEVFYVGFNGALNVNNATIRNLGGSDMAYAIDVVNATKVTLNITGSTIESTYIPVRIFNNSSGLNNVTITNSKIHGGNRAFWVHIYTAADNKGVIKSETLNFNIFNGTNAFTADKSTENPICYGFTNAYWYDKDGKFAYVDVENLDGLKAALEEGLNVRLYNDIDLTDASLTIPSGKKIELDLNGKTLSGKATSASASNLIKVSAKAELTITGKGKVSFYASKPDTNWGADAKPAYPGYANNTIRNEGTLIIDDAIIENRTARGGASYAIDCYSGSMLNVKNGTVKQSGGDIAIRMFCGNNVNVVIDGGEIIGHRAIWVQLAGSDNSVAPVVNLTINGGTLTSTDSEYKDAIYTYSFGNSFDNTAITITGGTFNGDVSFCGGKKIGTQKTNITGGTFNGDLGKYTADGWEDIAKP